MRDSGLTSVGPNCEKSTAGIAGRARAPVAAGGAPPAVAAPEPNAVLTTALTSSGVIRPLKPCPATRLRSTPSSRGDRRRRGCRCRAGGGRRLRLGGRLGPHCGDEIARRDLAALRDVHLLDDAAGG